MIVSLTLAEIGAGYPSRGTATVPSVAIRSTAAAAGNDFHQFLWSIDPILLIGEGTLSTISQPKSHMLISGGSC